MKFEMLALLLLSGLATSCALRLPLRRVSCDAGLRVETETAWLIFRKQDVLACAAVAERHFQVLDPTLAKQINYFSRRYSADTTQLTTVPKVAEVGSRGDTTGLYKALLFYIVDGYLLRQGRFCAIDKRTNRSFPWVRLGRINGPEDRFRVLRGPHGITLYNTTN